MAEIVTAGGTARFIAADLEEPDDIRRLAAAGGDVDVLVNNAAGIWFGPSAGIGTADLDRILRVNIRATYLLTAEIAPGMAARGHGSIVNVSGLAARIELPAGAAYGAAKGSTESLTRAWASEFSPAGVRVNAVLPGPLAPAAGSDPIVDAIAATTPLKRAARAEEVASVIGFLAGPSSSYMTGAVIPVDGGRTAV
ncbi:SDR family NAD(P)-dependent oxidoreductase [Catenuloplanes indicus]|uniref:NAD(P)-dependent dehydrogenase (Short-subunit alcohol dehydrogenase family) n=1 Tax=Catenuloplanes indicus TaxID=137267 RepID=A0AAE3VV92_9ACTN|nr:SDR family oxidoreductase [Catenuloplanes indicus]MDQ0364376.1 NAD(P)-dependent dehydrogenase (short-subunit alcohol dehydrogenase family) [Catenuloplanes indicus]